LVAASPVVEKMALDCRALGPPLADSADLKSRRLAGLRLGDFGAGRGEMALLPSRKRRFSPFLGSLLSIFPVFFIDDSATCPKRARIAAN
jgi:hypothetical protein